MSTLTPSQALNAIVTDGLWRKSLSAIRSLGKAGYRVSVMGDTWFTTGFWSRYSKERILAPVARQDPEAFGKTLLEWLSGTPGGAVLLPMEDPSLMWASAHREELASRGARFLLPPPESLEIAQDKARTMEIAEALGLPAPRSWRPESASAFAARALELEPGRFVAKPRSGTGSAGILYGESRTQAQWESHWERFGPMLLQERVPAEGRGLGVSLLLDRDSRPLAAFAHERIQQYPNSGGPSTDRQSVHAPELIQWSLKLLQQLKWSGIAMVEWKLDPRDGRPKLMEINPRFWGSLELAVRSGVDFPALYARAAQGERLEPQLRYPEGVRCRWLIPGDLLRYLTQPHPAREGVFRFLKGIPRDCEEWDPTDLRGTLSTLICTAALALNPRYWKYVRRG